MWRCTETSLLLMVMEKLFEAVRILAGKNQIGAGLNGGTTCICHLHVSQAYSRARSTRTSCALLFLDVAGLFASVVRRISIHGMPES